MSGTKRVVRRRGEICRLIEGAIFSGAFPPGTSFPSERELARRYGVSRTTICRALDKLTAAGLLTSQPRCGYTVKAVQNGQSTERHRIALVWATDQTLSPSNPFLAALERRLAEAGHVLMLASSRNDTARENETILRLQGAGTDGLIIAPAWHGAGSLELARWIDDDHPVILHGNPGFWVLPQTYADRCDMVDVDNAGGIRQALELLARHGHRTAGFVGQEALKGSERYEAFVRFAPQIGIATRPEWQIGEEDIPLETLRGAVGRIMGGTAHPTAFVCSHDGAALSLLDVLQELGLRCPDAISVVGFGNDNVNGNGKGSILTTIDIQCDKQVAVMLRLLGKQFAGVRDNPEHVRVPAVLVNRGTVAAPGGRAVEAAASR